MSLSPEPWVEEWLSPGRYRKFVRAAGGDHARALALYDWDAKLTAALLLDLGHLEVGLRNAYDRALLSHPLVTGKDWIATDVARQLLPPHWVRNEKGDREDKNKTPRESIKRARNYADYHEENGVPRGKVVAELMFGFWTYLSDSLHEKSLWVPALHRAFVPGTDRAKIHQALTDLRECRNRLAHNESVFDRAPENLRRSIVFVARQLSEPLRDHIVEQSSVSEILSNRP